MKTKMKEMVMCTFESRRGLKAMWRWVRGRGEYNRPSSSQSRIILLLVCLGVAMLSLIVMVANPLSRRLSTSSTVTLFLQSFSVNMMLYQSSSVGLMIGWLADWLIATLQMLKHLTSRMGAGSSSGVHGKSRLNGHAGLPPALVKAAFMCDKRVLAVRHPQEHAT